MRWNHGVLASLLAIAGCVETQVPERSTPRIVADASGAAYFVQGDLGQSESGRAMLGPETVDRGVLLAVSERIAPLFRVRAERGEGLAFRRSRVDARGNTHLRFGQQQRYGDRDLRIVGGELIAHVDPSGMVYAANGSARGPDVLASERRLTDNQARQVVNATGLLASDVELVFFAAEARPGQKSEQRLAYEIRARGRRDEMPVDDLVYVDADEGTILGSHPRVRAALKRRVYTAAQGTDTPGTLQRNEGSEPVEDEHVDGNYDRLGEAYRCYQEVFGRDSYDDRGALIQSTVHYDRRLANAFWSSDEKLLAFGDGDGQVEGLQGVDVDTVVHEFTHAVTSTESDLVYKHQSGGLDESMSDVMAAVCASWADGWSTARKVFLFSESTFLEDDGPEALRFLDDPAENGKALDHIDDYDSDTDVHNSSGIPNLVFSLLAKGGHHPRDRTETKVRKIGPEQAGRIFYTANADYFTSGTTFQQALTYMEEAARSLGFDVAAVTNAWTAVGVEPPPPPTPVDNGHAVTLQSNAEKSSRLFTFEVPPEAKSIVFETGGGTGDVDLYVRRGLAPELDDDDELVSSGGCESSENTTEERIVVGTAVGGCRLESVRSGTWYVLVRGFHAYSGVRFTASWDTVASDPNEVPAEIKRTYTGTVGDDEYERRHWSIFPGTEFDADLTGTGDVDLYVRWDQAATRTEYDCRPFREGSDEGCSGTVPDDASEVWVTVLGESDDPSDYELTITMTPN